MSALGSPDGPATGLLDATNGGFAPDIWSGSPRDLIEDLLARAPVATPLTLERALARRLLLTKADAPLGQAPHAFQTVRLEALLNGGFVAEAGALAPQISLPDDPEFGEVQARAILLAGRAGDACGPATQKRLTDPGLVWMQLRAYCYGLSGQDDLLELTRGVMKAQGTDSHAFETLLDDVLTHTAVDPGPIPSPTAVEVFLIEQAGLPLRPDLAAKFGLAASALVFRDTKDPPDVRAQAAEQVVHAGAATTAELTALADAQVFTSDKFAQAAQAAQDMPFFLGQSLLRQAVAHATADPERAKLVVAALVAGQQAGLLPVAARLEAGAAARIKPAPELHYAAGIIARALLLMRRADAAEAWHDMLDPNSESDRPLEAELAVELNLVAPDPVRAAHAQAALSWLVQNATSPQPAGGAALQGFGALAYATYEALGEALPAGVLAPAPPPGGWLGRTLAPNLEKLLGEGRGRPDLKGQTLLAVLDALGAQGPGGLAPGAAAELVCALKDEGEGETARALAIDALVLSPSGASP